MLITIELALYFSRSLTVPIYTSTIAYNKGVQPSLSFKLGSTRPIVRSSLTITLCPSLAKYNSSNQPLLKEPLDLESTLT
jgi:hypothetical protein